MMIDKTTTNIPLARCFSYERLQLKMHLAKIIGLLDENSSYHGKTVLLKPNLISSRGQSLACTRGEVIAAVARYFLDNGAKVLLGDSPAFGTTESVMNKQGITGALKGMPVMPVRFKTPVLKQLEKGDSIQIAAEALDCDFFVNLPKLKAHNQMFITAAVKNMFGCVVGARKAMLHMTRGNTHQQFSDILVQIPQLLPPQISVVDAIEVMHKSGPLDGEPLLVGCLGGAVSPYALDSSLLELLQLPKTKSPLWKSAQQRSMVEADSSHYIYPLKRPEQFHGSGFIAPTLLNPIRFNPLRFIVSSIRRLGLAIRTQI